MLQKLGRIYPPIFEVLPFLLLFSVLYMVISGYDSLPAQIPTHFNFHSIPDGLGGKSVLFPYPGFAWFLYISITGVGIVMAVIHDPQK
jgi:uncharacterized membrane protein